MAIKFSALPADTAPTSDDLVAVVNDPAGTPASKKVTLANLTKGLDVLVGDSGAGGTKGLVPAPAAGDAAAKKFLNAAGAWDNTADGTNLIGFRNIPQNSQSAAYTTVLADAGKHIFHPSTDANARTFTIDSNANVAYPIGTAITFINMTAQVVTIAITADTLYLAEAGTTGSRSLAQYGVATAVKIATTAWIISGSGLT